MLFASERRQVVLSGITAGIIAVAGCVSADSESRILILQNQDTGAGGACTLSTQPTTTFIAAGIIDTASASGYVFNPVIENFSTVPSNINQTQRFFFIEGADVTIDIGNDSDGLPVLTDEERAALPTGTLTFRRSFTGVVEPSGGTAAVSIVVLPKEVLDLIAAKTPVPVELTVDVQVFGSMAGSDASTQIFTYPITVCTDCIKVDAGPCAALPSGFEARPGGGCNVFQDMRLDCCTSATGAEVCPAVPE